MDRKTRMVLEALAVERSSGPITRAICPFCVASGHLTRKKKLDYNLATGKWSCWRCHAWGRLTPAEGLDAATHVGGGPGDRTGPLRGGNGPSRPPAVDPPEGFFPVGNPPSLLSQRFHRYALGRGITGKVVSTLGFGMTNRKPDRSAPDRADWEQDFRERLIIPIKSPEDPESWLGYVGRSITPGSSLPYLYSKGLSRARILYLEELLWIETDVPALIVEGTLDAAYLYPNGVAVLGTWGPEQLELMKRARRPIVAVLDGDAWRKGEALAMSLQLYGVRASWLRLPPKKDPDEFPPAEIMEMAIRSLK